jgi:hypothetical protein
MQSSLDEVQRLGMAMLICHKRKGEMLQNLKTSAIDQFDTILANEQISEQHAELCIALHNQWELVLAAVSDSETLPTTVGDALLMLIAWKARHIH